MDESRGNGVIQIKKGELGWWVLSCLETARQLEASSLYWKPNFLYKDKYVRATGISHFNSAVSLLSSRVGTHH